MLEGWWHPSIHTVDTWVHLTLECFLKLWRIYVHLDLSCRKSFLELSTLWGACSNCSWWEHYWAILKSYILPYSGIDTSNEVPPTDKWLEVFHMYAWSINSRHLLVELRFLPPLHKVRWQVEQWICRGLTWWYFGKYLCLDPPWSHHKESEINPHVQNHDRGYSNLNPSPSWSYMMCLHKWRYGLLFDSSYNCRSWFPSFL